MTFPVNRGHQENSEAGNGPKKGLLGCWLKLVGTGPNCTG